MTVQVAPTDPSLRRFLARHPDRTTDEPLAAAWLYRRGAAILGVLLVYVHPLGLLVSFIAATPRPFVVLHRLVRAFETWARARGLPGYGFIVTRPAIAFRALVEHYGARPVATRGDDLLYLRTLGAGVKHDYADRDPRVAPRRSPEGPPPGATVSDRAGRRRGRPGRRRTQR